MKTAIATERSDLHRLVSTAIKAANSQSVSGVERCFDIVRYLKSLSLSSKDLRELSREIHPLENLRNHANPKIRLGVQALFNSWMSTLYSSGREASSNCNKALLQKYDVAKVSSELKKKEERRYVAGVSENPRFPSLKTAKNIACKYTPTRIRLHVAEKKLNVSKLKKKEEEKSQVHEDCEIKLKKPIQEKKQKTPPLKLSENPRFGIQGTGAVKPDVCKSVLALKKNATEMLELFEIAKKSADVANTKGLLMSKAETSICIDTLSLLMDFPISATSSETRRIMMKLEHLTKHKDRKICNSASILLHHWRHSIINETK